MSRHLSLSLTGAVPDYSFSLFRVASLLFASTPFLRFCSAPFRVASPAVLPEPFCSYLSFSSRSLVHIFPTSQTQTCTSRVEFLHHITSRPFLPPLVTTSGGLATRRHIPHATQSTTAVAFCSPPQAAAEPSRIQHIPHKEIQDVLPAGRALLGLPLPLLPARG